MEFTTVRELAIIAMFSDDALFDQVVLKGGNALRLVHKLGSRTSLDLDFSIPGDFADPDDIKTRVFNALKDRFDSAGFIVFDGRFTSKFTKGKPQWGGYVVEFKLISEPDFRRLSGKLDAIRRESEVLGPLQQRVFKIQISRFEFCDVKAEAELDGFTIYVYTPAMIAIEKLRAMCQQMREYPGRSHKTPRARDFYDVHAILTAGNIDLTTPENLELIRQIFAAKEVPMELLRLMEDYRALHEQDWPSVVASVSGELRDYDYYFDFVLREVGRLETFWVE